MQTELSDEDLVIILAGLKTLGVAGTDAMRRVIALEDRLMASSPKPIERVMAGKKRLSSKERRKQSKKGKRVPKKG